MSVVCCVGNDSYSSSHHGVFLRTAKCSWDRAEGLNSTHVSLPQIGGPLDQLIVTPFCKDRELVLSSHAFDAVSADVSRIDMSFNRFELTPDDDFYSRFKNLTDVVLDENDGVSMKFLRYLLEQPQLRLLSARRVGLLSTALRNMLVGLDQLDLKLETLWLGGNSFKGILQMKTISLALPNLRDFDLSYGCVQAVSVSQRLQEMTPVFKLEVLNLTHNSLKHFPRTCNGNRYNLTWAAVSYPRAFSIYPTLTTPDLSHNELEQTERGVDVCLPSLHYLNLRGNKLDPAHDSVFYVSAFPALEYLDLGSQAGVNSLFAEGPSRSVKLGHEQSSGFLSGAPLLKHLDLDGANFHMVTEKSFVQLLGHLHDLNVMSLANCRLEFISSEMLAPFPLLESLNLRGNAIANVPDGCFDSMKRLADLNLSGNKITVISEETFSSELLHQLQTLDLAHNPYVCTCDLMWFRNWFMSRRDSVLGNATWLDGSYRCYNLHGAHLVHFNVVRQACFLSPQASGLLILSCSIAISTFTAFVLLFRFRWHLRLVLYEAFRGRDDVRRRYLQQGHFDFDLFVSYTSGDLRWVQRHLIPELETRLGLRLCIHDREFVLGENIVDNIADFVQRSKKILMVFSKDFKNSDWCQFELAYCLTHVMDYDDALIIVCLDDVTSYELTSSMMAVLKTTTYIQWWETMDAIRAFWGRLQQALHEVLQLEEHLV
jgi:toll-like receptor 13